MMKVFTTSNGKNGAMELSNCAIVFRVESELSSEATHARNQATWPSVLALVTWRRVGSKSVKAVAGFSLQAPHRVNSTLGSHD